MTNLENSCAAANGCTLCCQDVRIRFTSEEEKNIFLAKALRVKDGRPDDFWGSLVNAWSRGRDNNIILSSDSSTGEPVAYVHGRCQTLMILQVIALFTNKDQKLVKITFLAAVHAMKREEKTSCRPLVKTKVEECDAKLLQKL